MDAPCSLIPARRCTMCAGANAKRRGDGRFVWVFQISGAVPPRITAGGYAESRQRAPAGNVFPAGRRHAQGRLQARASGLEPGVCGRRAAARGYRARHGWSNCRGRRPSAAGGATTPQWPIMHAMLHGVSRDQLMARHQANHVNVAYAPGRRRCRPRAGGQSGHVRRPGGACAFVRSGDLARMASVVSQVSRSRPGAPGFVSF